MKFKNFMEEYGWWILFAVIILVVIAAFFLPFIVALARSMWRWALAEKVYWG